MSSVRDIIFIVIVLFVVGTSTFFMAKMGHEINTKLLTVPTFNSTPEVSQVISSSDTAINYVDYIYLALFLGFFIGLFVFGWFVGGYPILAPIYFILVILFSFFAVIFQLVWNDMSANAQLVSTVASLPITNYILAHLGYFTVAMGLLGIISMYAKPPEVYP